MAIEHPYFSIRRKSRGQSLPLPTQDPLCGCSSPMSDFSSATSFTSPSYFCRSIHGLQGPWTSSAPTGANLTDVAVHCVLFVVQLSFLVSLPFLLYLPISVYLLYVAAVLGLNFLVCLHFNKGIPKNGLESTEDEYSRQWTPHDDECWIFLNGICVG